MKSISEENLKLLIKKCIEDFGEYEKVKFITKVNGKETILNGIRLLDAQDNENFIVKDKNGKHFSFPASEVPHFDPVEVVKQEDEVSYNPLSELQKTIADKVEREKQQNMKESQSMAIDLSNSIGYFPLLQSATTTGLTIDFLNKSNEVENTVVFPFVKGEGYEVYSHEDEMEITLNALVVDVSLATTIDGDEVPELYTKYYETYKAIQDLEFIPDDNYTKEIFNTYRLDEKYAKVVGDLNKHDLLELVTENSKDQYIIEAANELRSKKNKTSSKMKI